MDFWTKKHQNDEFLSLLKNAGNLLCTARTGADYDYTREVWYWNFAGRTYKAVEESWRTGRKVEITSFPWGEEDEEYQETKKAYDSSELLQWQWPRGAITNRQYR